MKVAIVIPSHKRPESLRETLCSIFDTGHVTTPIIVVHKYDDVDVESLQSDMLNIYDPGNLWFVRQEPGTRGPASAVNLGLREAIKRGVKYVFRVDDDIRVHRGNYDIIQTMINALEANPHVGIVSAWNRSLAWRQRNQPKLARMTNPAQLVGFRVSALEEVKLEEGKYFDERYLTREDTELTIRHFIAGWECAVVDHKVTYDHVAPAYGADSTFAQERNDGVEVKMCNQLASQYDFVRVSAHPKRQDLRRVSYLPQLRKMGVVSEEFEWEDFELASRS